MRAAALSLLRVVGTILTAILIHAPLWVLSRPLVQALFRSRVALALGRFVIKPATIAAAAAGVGMLMNDLRVHHRHLAYLPSSQPLPVAAVVFVVTAVALNTRVGILVEEMAIDALVRALRRVQRDVLPGIFRLIEGFFRGITDAIDRGIYTVDEWLRFRSGQGRSALWAKGVLGVLWFAVAYLLRVLVNLFLEPTINPLKHFPTVTVAAKVMWATVGPPLHAALMPVFGRLRAGTITGLAMTLLPGFFGFLVWELKENYRLYEATRRATLQPVPIGHHGETMGGLLRPGLHSGTLPKLWAKLRRAARKGDGSVEKHREALREIEEAVERFVDRELSGLLAECELWKGRVHVTRVALASNRVRVELQRSGHEAAEACAIAFEEQSGWLVAGVAHAGWVGALEGDERVIFENALAGLLPPRRRGSGARADRRRAARHDPVRRRRRGARGLARRLGDRAGLRFRQAHPDGPGPRRAAGRAAAHARPLRDRVPRSRHPLDLLGRGVERRAETGRGGRPPSCRPLAHPPRGRKTRNRRARLPKGIPRGYARRTHERHWPYDTMPAFLRDPGSFASRARLDDAPCARADLRRGTAPFDSLRLHRTAERARASRSR